MKKLIYLILSIFIGCTIQNPVTYVEVPQSKVTLSINPVTPVVPQPPAAPLVFSVTSGLAQNTLTWSPIANATGYNIYFATTPGVNKLTGTKITNVSSPYIHTGLINGTTYYYVVTAYDANGESTESVEIHATAGVIDNHNGTVTITHLNQVWPKCGQINVLGANTYNPVVDDCSGGTQGLMAYCVPGDWSCVDPINPTYLNGMGNSEVWQSCNALSGFAGRAWKVPTTVDFEAFQSVYVKNLAIFSGLAVGRYWIGDAFPWYAIGIDDNMFTAPSRSYPWYVICVGM